jgi:Protein of unknown function (DUF3237)
MAEELLRPLLELEVTVSDPLSLGQTPLGERRLIPITGGRFQGRLSGRVLPGGADWQLIRPDGVADIAARYVLETDAGARIEVRSEGYRHGPPEVLERLARGEPVPPEAYYFRTAMRFETAQAELAWLNGALAVAWGERLPHTVRLRVLEVR